MCEKSYMKRSEIRNYKISHNDKTIPEKPLNGHSYWHCPRCKKALGVVNGRFVEICENCGQKNGEFLCRNLLNVLILS